MQFKKFTYILILLLLGASGLLSGCKTIYDRMKLELSTETIELYLPLEEDVVEEPAEEPSEDGENLLNEQATVFTATVSNVPKNILKTVTYQTTNDSIVAVNVGEEEGGSTEIEVVALRAGSTNLIIKTMEGNKSKTVAVSVIKRIEDMTLNENYKLAVAVGSSVNINTAQAIQFYPFNTNQKDVKYSLDQEVQGVTVSEAGLITVTEKTANEINITATSISDESLSVSFSVVIIEPIEQDDILLTTQNQLDKRDEWVTGGGLPEEFDLAVTNLLMANNHSNANEGTLLIEVQSSEVYNIVATSSNNDIVEVLQIEPMQNGMYAVQLKANNLGQITITVKAEIVGYEHYFATKEVTVVVANFATSVSISGSTSEREFIIYNNYASMLGREIKLDVAPSTAYSKQIKLYVNPDDLHKITITYSDGTVIPEEEVNSTILPRGMSIFVSANVVSSNPDLLLRQQENTVEILFIANSTIDSSMEVTNKAILTLTQGATNLTVPESLSLQAGLSSNEYPDVTFLVSPIEAVNDTLTIQVENSNIADFVHQGGNVYKIVGKNEGTTRIFVTTSNGIQKIINVEVYVPLVGAALQIESPAQNHNIAVRELDATPNQYESLVRATIAVGAGIQMNVAKYPSNASIIGVTYASSSSAIASINNNGYILARAIGTTIITVTLESKEFSDNQTSTIKTTVKTFELTTYVPIKEINLNALQIELYEQNSLGYFDLDKSKYQFAVAITPSNATFNQQNIVWSTSSQYVSVVGGLVTVSIPSDVILPNNTLIATVTASVSEFGRYYAKTAVITIKRAVKVDSITVFNIPQGYVYFDAREGVQAAGTKQIVAQTYPYTATNSKLRYVYANQPQNENERVFSVSSTGLITPLKAGIATLHVVAEDSYTNENTYIRYNEIVVKVADGLTEQTALELYSSNDIRGIDTEYELGLHYVLANNIDFLNQAFTPIGFIEGQVYPFTGSINGQFTYGNIQKTYQIKGLTFATNNALEYYAGFVAQNNGTLKNLNIELSNWSITTSNNNLDSMGYFGGVSAINNGTIQNTVISISSAVSNNAILQVANRTSYVGLIAAKNNGNIITSVAHGRFEVKQKDGISTTPLVYVGGMVGFNAADGLVEGAYAPANKLLGVQEEETTYTNENVLYQKEGMNAYPTIFTNLLQHAQNATGVAVGYNQGTINKLATDGFVTGANNVGGVAGMNTGIVSNSYSASQIIGGVAVGGLIGYATTEQVGAETFTSHIVNNAVEIYDRKNTYEQADIIIKGVNYVGGLIGYTDALDAFTYNYVSSYVLRTIGENYSGDIVLSYEDQNEYYFVGGLIGGLNNVSTVLEKNYANANLATLAPQTTNNTPTLYAGGLIGGVTGNFELKNSYTKGQIVLPLTNSFAGQIVGAVVSAPSASVDFVYSVANVTAQVTNGFTGQIEAGSVVNITNADYLLWDIENSAIWYQNANVNGGYPALYNEQGNLLINEAPEEVIVVVQQSTVTTNVADNSVSFHHLKVDDKKAVVLLKQDSYSIRNLISTTPNNARYYLTTEQTDIVQILDDGSIKTLKEGTAIIRVSSVLNKNIFDTFELAVVKGFTNFVLSKTQGVTDEQLNLESVINLKLQESIILYSTYTNYDQQVGNLMGATYTATAGGFTVNGANLGTALSSASTHILQAGNVPSLGNILVTVTPHYTVSFGGQQIIVQLPQLRKQFYVSIYEGASSVTTSMVSAVIGLTEEIELEVYMVTDKAGDELALLYGQLDQDESDRIDNYIETEYLGTERIYDNESNYLYDIFRYKVKAKADFLEVNLGSGNFKSAKAGTISFTPQSNNELTTNFHITITPQDLLRIDMAHYPTGETQIENGKAVYYPRELPSNIIAPAQPGILKVNLYPEYANIDYYQIVSSVNGQGQFVSLEQVALITNLTEGIENSISYSAVTPAPTGIPYGTTLNLISSAVIEGSTITNLFDGNIFIKTLISSAVQKGQTFTLTVTGYRVDEFGVAHSQLSKQITLTVDALPGVTLLYKGERTGYVERGTVNELELYVSDNYSGILRNPVPTIVYANTDGVNAVTGNSKSVTVEEDENEKGKFYLVVGHGVPSGTTIQVTAKVERTINGILEERTSTIYLQVVNFLIDRVTVENTLTDNQTNRMNMYIGERSQLLVSLKSAVWQQRWSEDILDELYQFSGDRDKLQNIKDAITEEVEYLQKMFSRNLSTWYEQTGSNPVIKTALEENTYPNYLIYRNSNPNAQAGEYAYEGQKDVFVGARRISANTVLGAEINYYYDENGLIQPVVFQNSKWLKYPQVNQMEEALATISNENILKLRTSNYSFNLNITPNSTEDKPVPIYNEQDFKNMQPGIDYILLNDINEPLVLENWLPLNTAIKSLDGNNRVIKIKSFASNVTAGSFNFGLFGTINENTVLKNIQLDIGDLALNEGIISATEFTEVNFGFLAGVNNGTINNVDIVNSNSSETAIQINTNATSNVTFGGLVGQNLGGYITNSRVGRIESSKNWYPISVKVRGMVAGFVGHNNGVITSSYVANLTLENTSLVLQNSRTAGFVALNSNYGRISLSFVEGIQQSINDLPQGNKVIQRGGLYSIGNIGGFAHENQGTIADAFANIPVITESRSAGFVYKNASLGSITNAYSLSKIAERSLAHLPFIGSDSLEVLLNEGVLNNTYYLANANYFTSQFEEGYPAVAVSDFAYYSSFNGFGFLNETGYEKYGAWEISSSNPRPTIPSALEVTSSERILTDTTIVGGAIVEYRYTEADYTDKKGTGNNPILVANARQFLEAMTMSPNRDANTKINKTRIRLIKDINFNEIVNIDEQTGQGTDEETKLKLANLQQTIFAGKLDGNGMTLQNVRVLSSIYTEGMQESFGMFSQIGYDDTTYLNENRDKAVVKNLNIEVAEVSATEAISVGVLTGQILNSIILNVSISGQNITIQGRNLVGGLAGIIAGDSRIINVSSSLSISSEYRTTNTLPDQVTIDYSYYNEYGVEKDQVSYAGAIAGVIDVYVFDDNGEKQTSIEWEIENPKIVGLTVKNNLTIRAEKTGGVIGYIGPFTYVKNVLFEINHINSTQKLIGYDLLGGVVAENSGLLDHSRIQHETNYQIDTIDKTAPKTVIGYQALIDDSENANFVGGLVGYNNMGTIKDSYSRLDINNSRAHTVGGLIGINYGGYINRVYATGHLSSNNVIGGLIGNLSDQSLQSVSESGVSNDQIAMIKNALAVNNWQLSAFQNVYKSEDINNGAWRNSDSTPNTSKFIGGFIGEVNNVSHLGNITRSWYIDEVFSVLSSLPVEDAQVKQLREAGNVDFTAQNNADELKAVAREGNKTQFETITDLSLISTQDKYGEFVDSPTDSLWTFNSPRFPQLRFYNVSDIRQVTNEDELDAVRNFPTSTVIIMNDITLTRNWAPMAFRGIMIGKETNGVFPTIYNININNALQDTGFFSTLNSASVSNINFVFGGGSWDGNINGVKSTATTENSTMGLIAGNINNAAIKNVHISLAGGVGGYYSSTHYTGLIAGKAKNIIVENFSLNSTQLFLSVVESIDPTDNYAILYVGGAFGQVETGTFRELNIAKVEIYVQTNSLLYLGGFAGILSSVNASLIEINVDTKIISSNLLENYYTGGFMGYGINVTLVSVKTLGSIIANEGVGLYVGGVAGYLENGTLTNVSYENLTATAISVEQSATNAKVGGLVGHLINTYVENSHAIANIELKNISSSAYIGGLVGHLQNNEDYKVSLSYAKTNITATNQNQVYVGGLIGSTSGSQNTLKLEEVYSEGKLEIAVSATVTLNVGGLIGRNTVKVNYAFSATRIFAYNGNQKVGGLVGDNSESIQDAYFYGTIYSNRNTLVESSNFVVNPLIGINRNAINNRIYFNKDIIGLTERTQYEGMVSLLRPNKSHNQLLAMSLPEQDNIFIKSTGTYPYLKNLPTPDINTGSLLNPIRIASAQDFANMGANTGYYVQTTSFTVTNSLPDFNGIYNGNALTITYNKSATSGNVGIFEITGAQAMVANLGVVANLELLYNETGAYNVGGLVVNNYGVIYKSYAKTTVTPGQGIQNRLRYFNFGGLVANNYHLIENSFANVEMTINLEGNYNDQYTRIGGLVGYSGVSGNSIPTINTSFVTGRMRAYQIGIIPGSTGATYYSTFIGQQVDTNIYNSYSAVTSDISAGSGITVLSPLFGASENSQVSNTYYDRFAYGTSDTDTRAKTTKEMISDNFKTTLSANNMFSGIWVTNKTINYGYPYPYYYNNVSYANNVLNTGDGTYTYPYLITHAGRLDWVRTQLTSAAYFKQTNNINLNIYNAINTQFLPIGSIVTETETKFGTAGDTAFIGIYDGQNYTISNLVQTFSSADVVKTGLFASLLGNDNYKYGYIYNTNLRQMNITIDSGANIDSAFIGSIAGTAGNGSKIINSSAMGTISDLRDNTNVTNRIISIGGLTGYAGTVVIDSSYASVNMTAATGLSYIGGLIGWSDGADVKNSYTANNLTVTPKNSPSTSEYYLGGIIGYSNNTYIYNVHNNKNITIDTIPFYLDQYGESTVYVKVNNTPLNKGTGGVVGYMSGGQITHATNSGNINFKALDNDMNVLGGVIGYDYNVAKLETLSNTASITATYAAKDAKSTYIGGIIGFTHTTSDIDPVLIQYISNTGNITATPLLEGGNDNANNAIRLYLGGLIGGTSTYTPTSSSRVSLLYTYNTGNITATAPLNSYVGGLVGSFADDIKFSYNTGNIELNHIHQLTDNRGISPVVYVGGIVGYMYRELKAIENSYNTGTITARRPLDNIVLQNKKIDIYVGGIAGKITRAKVNRVYNTGNIVGHIGYNNIEHEIYVGGLFGYVESTNSGTRSMISNSYNRGTITGYIASYGEEVEAIGGSIFLGGIGGRIDYTTLEKVYISSYIEMTGSGYYYWYGYFAGRSSGLQYYVVEQYSHTTTYTSFYNVSFQSGIYGYPGQSSERIYNTAKTYSQMQNQSTYNTWDFTSVWNSPSTNVLPTLKNMPENIDITSGSTAEPSIILTGDLPRNIVTTPNVQLSAPSGGGGGGGGTPNPTPPNKPGIEILPV